MNSYLSNPVVLDVETTISNDGNPFDYRNTLVLLQLKTRDNTYFYTKENFFDSLDILNKATCLIGQNLKFDLLWIRRVLNYIHTKSVWDTQIAEFLFSNQQWKYPDLDTMCKNYGVGEKIHTIEEKYWSQGIDTDQIPMLELAEYGIHDVELNWKVFEKQLERFQTTDKGKYALFRLHCNDLLVLQEMEYNGIIYDEIGSKQKAEELELDIKKIESELNSIIETDILNYNSNDDISILLYGGSKTQEIRIPIGYYKSGQKLGLPRYKIERNLITFPQLIKPLKNSELKKGGFYATDVPTLLSLHPTGKAKKIISLLLERSKLEKINSTYLKGFPKLREKHNWPVNKLHSNLNQCSVVTGRLSSTKPNQQNLADLAKYYCKSRF